MGSIDLQAAPLIVQRHRVTVLIDMGLDGAGAPAQLDLEELLATRLLVQGNSGSGKSHLLRRLLEGSAPWVQQIVIDPEGDFVTLDEAFGHVPIHAAEHSEAEITRLAARVREHRTSVVLSLEGLDVDAQMRCAAAFLNALFDAPRDHWYPALVVVDEAQLFAPAVAGEVSDEARRASLGAMTNLMCRGRKRGLAGVIATQRLAKLAKNVAAEASNFLMGRTFLDIDMARAADLLGMDRRQAETIRDLERGHFLALGPALSRRPIAIRIGEVKTHARSSSPRLMPMPEPVSGEAQMLLFAAEPVPPPPPRERPGPPPSPPAHELIVAASPTLARPTDAAVPEIDAEKVAAIIDDALRDMVDDKESAYQPAAGLYHDFTLRCRMARLPGQMPDLAEFKRRLAMARAGIFSNDALDGPLADAISIAETLDEDVMAVFLMIARAAQEGRECPDDDEIARIYGTRSPSRARRLLGYMEEKDLIVVREDLGGKRSIGLPDLGWTTAATAR